MSDSHRDGAFALADAQATLEDACAEAGISSNGAQLLRLGENALFRLAHEEIIVRIARSAAVLADAQKEVQVAAWLRRSGILAAEPTSHAQPLLVLDHPVTFWKLIDDSGTKPTLAALGSILRELHSLPVPDQLRLPAFDIFGRVSERISEAGVLSTAERAFLLQRLEDLRHSYARFRFTLRAAAVHGDAHQGNLIQRADGQVLLIDFERFASGPPETDLAVTATEYLIGWHTDAAYASFCEAYDFDIMQLDGFPVLRAINELKMTTWLMQNAGESEQIANEFRTRLASLHDDESPRCWQAF